MINLYVATCCLPVMLVIVSRLSPRFPNGVQIIESISTWDRIYGLTNQIKKSLMEQANTRSQTAQKEPC
jgi:hypothetical protein